MPVLQWSALFSTALQQTLCVTGYHCALFRRVALKLSVFLTQSLNWGELSVWRFGHFILREINPDICLVGVTTGTGARLGIPPMPEVGTPGVQSLYLSNKIRKLREFSFTSFRWKLLRGIYFIHYISHVTYSPRLSVTRTLWLRIIGW